MTPREIVEQAKILQKGGAKEKDIAAIYGLHTMELRMLKSCHNRAERIAKVGRARVMKKEGMSVSEIAEAMEVSEAMVRLLLDEEENRKLYLRMLHGWMPRSH